VDAPCDVFTPGEPGHGECDTDGHYLCVECVHISSVTLRKRRDECTDCGAKLIREPWSNGEPTDCPNKCHVAAWMLPDPELAQGGTT